MQLSQKPIVGFDMDGTLVNYNERLYEEIQNSKKIPQEIKNILFDTKNRKHIDLSLSIDYKQTNITREEVTNMLNNIRQTKTFFKSLSFRPEVITTLKELNEIFDIHFVSKPSEKVESQSEYIKAKLISDSLGNARRKKLHLTFDKTMRRGNILVDDDPNIYHNKNYKPNRIHILMDQPHNQHINTPRLFLTQQKKRQKIIEENLY